MGGLRCPSFAWYGLIVVAVLSMAWGGPLFGILTGTPPIMKAAWRLQFTALLMIPGFLVEWRHADQQLRLRWRQNLWLTVGNGLNLALHFSFFSWSVNHTSFAHAMILASSAPVFLALWSLALFGAFSFLKRSMSAQRADNLGELAADGSAAPQAAATAPQSLPRDDGGDDWAPSSANGSASGLAAADSVQKQYEYVYALPSRSASASAAAAAGGRSSGSSVADTATVGRRSRGHSLAGAGFACSADSGSNEMIGRRSSSHFVEEASGGGVLTCELESPGPLPSGADTPPGDASPQSAQLQPAPPSTASERSLHTLLRMFGSKAPPPPAAAASIVSTAPSAISAGSSSLTPARDRFIIPKPTATELIGALVAFGGMVILVLLTQREQQASVDEAAGAAAAATAQGSNNTSSASSAVASDAPTIRPFSVEGDIASAAAAVLMGANLLVGGRLRAWMPLWLYSLPTFIAAAGCAAMFSLLVEDGTTFFSTGPLGTFGWLGTGRRFGLAFLMAFVPTICGHTVSNFALSRVSPLIMSVTLLLAPPISSLYGYALGLQGPPGAGLLLGGPVIIIGIAVTVLGSHKSPLWGMIARARARRAGQFASHHGSPQAASGVPQNGASVMAEAASTFGATASDSHKAQRAGTAAGDPRAP